VAALGSRIILKKLISLGLLAILGLLLVGCDSGTGNVQSAEKNAQDMKEFNDKALQENPPPPGEGPGN
jgi:hypothetical protein